MRKLLKKTLAAVLCAALICAVVPFALASEGGTEIAVMSDMHFFPQEYIGSTNGYNYRCAVDNDRKLEQYSDEIMDAALNDIAAEAPDCLIIPGDIVMSGQYEGHVQVARKLRALEEKGVEVYVIPGNHDISLSGEAFAYPAEDLSKTVEVAGETYVIDSEKTVKGTTLSEFRELYADFGYGEDGNIIARAEDSLSYVAQMNGCRLIAIDANVYDGENATKEKELPKQRLAWITKQITDCIAAGDTPVAMMHYNVLEKYPGQTVVMGNNYLPDNNAVAKALAKAGLQYLFTGHSHANEITSVTVDGKSLYEICTGSLLLHGSPYRFAEFSGGDAKIRTKKVQSIDGIEDFQAFCENYFYPEGVRIMMRNRAVVVAAQALAETFESERLPYDKGYGIFVDLMQGIIDGILAMELDGGITAGLLLSEAYKQHYAGDEVYTPEIKAAVAQLKSGEAFEKALIIAFESIGRVSGISEKLAGLSENYRVALRNAAAMSVLASVSNILGAMGGAFIEGIFIDITPGDNDIDIISGTAHAADGTAAPQRTFWDKFISDFKIVIEMIFAAFGINLK